MTDSENPLVRCYQSWISALRYAQPAILLALRLLIGVGFLLAGWGKLTNIDSTAEQFKGLHIPMPELNAYMAGGTETVCGFLLILGFASRVITVPLIFTMIVAYATAHVNIFDCIGHNPTAFIKAFVQAAPFPYLTVVLVVLLFGPGLYSVDGVLARLFRGAKPETSSTPPGMRR
jgi:putative oxidoreductase